MPWKCPKCKRAFRSPNQRHSCGTGDRDALLRNRPEPLLELYRALERELSTYRGVEIVTKERYALFRTTRIFADLVFMRDALRLAIHLNRSVSHPLFFKVVRGQNGRVTHVVRLKTAAEWQAMQPYLREAYDCAHAEA